jgi:exodeoxyribonuclease VII large subunit
MYAAFQNTFSGKREAFVREAAALDAMSPLKVLSRGYAMASGENGTMIRSVEQISRDQIIDLRLADGSASCRVLEIRGEEYTWKTKQ